MAGKESKELINAIRRAEPIVRDFIYEIETVDYSSLIQELFVLRQQRAALITLYREKDSCADGKGTYEICRSCPTAKRPERP